MQAMTAVSLRKSEAGGEERPMGRENNGFEGELAHGISVVAQCPLRRSGRVCPIIDWFGRSFPPHLK